MERADGYKALLLRMGAESFRDVTKDMIVDLVDGLPTVDPEVALQVLAQIPNLAKMASEVLADNAGAHRDTLQAEAHGADQLHELRLNRQRALIELIGHGDASETVMLQAMSGLGDIEDDARGDNAARRVWWSQESEKRMKAAMLQSAQVALIALLAAKSGSQPTSALTRLLPSRLPTLPKG